MRDVLDYMPRYPRFLAFNLLLIGASSAASWPNSFAGRIHGDGIWLDGIGPDNGAYMCSGVCCGYGASNSPVTQPEIDSHCAAQAAATTQLQRWLIANGGWEAQKCFNYNAPSGHGDESDVTDMGGFSLPSASDSPSSCASKLQHTATAAANHANYNFVVAYGSRTGGRAGYNDTTVAGTVAVRVGTLSNPIMGGSE